LGGMRFPFVVLGCVVALGSGLSSAQPAGPWNDATVYRDAYGTPHVHAASVRAMAFAFGHAQAEDHLEPMLLAYRMALGRAAAVGGEKFASGDAFAIKIANAQVSRAAMMEADGLTRDLCEGFALGINTWIADHQDEVAPWVEGVQPMDVLAYWHYLMVTSAPFDLPDIYHPEPPLIRANAWALAPSKTVGGKTLLVMNPHQYYRPPYQWYEAHLMVGEMNWAGATLLGVPVLLMAHNGELGWALTPNSTDFADFFRERTDAPERNPSVISRPSVLDEIAPVLAFMSSAKTYHVQMDGGLDERSVPSYVGPRGPVFEGASGGLFSWRNGAFKQFGGLAQLFDMARATDLASFQEAMLYHQLPCFQVLYADKVGNLFYLYNARTGNKNAAVAADETNFVDWQQPQDASRDQFAWKAIVPPEQLPLLENPASGYIQSCGTPPWLATANSGLFSADWPAWLVPEDQSYRAFRVNQILSAGKYTFEDMGAMLFDTLVPAAVDMVPLVLDMARSRGDLVRGAHPDLVIGLTLLENWNLTSDHNVEALAYYARWWSLIKERHQPSFNNEADLYRALLENSPEAQVYALEAAADAARAMRNDFNRLAIPWGELNRLQRGNLNRASAGTGVGDPLFVVGSAPGTLLRRQAEFGYGFAMAVEFGDTVRARSIVPFGASSDPRSPHYSDQMTLFLNRDMKLTYFGYDEVVQNATRGYGRHVVLGTPGLDGYCSFRLTAPDTISMEAVSYPPRPYPSGQVPFTPTVRPAAENSGKDFSWELEWYVPETVCSKEDLSRLHFYIYTRDGAWEPVLRQEFDSERGSFAGSGTGEVMITIMGPANALKTLERPGGAEVPAPEEPTQENDAEQSGAFDPGAMPDSGSPVGEDAESDAAEATSDVPAPMPSTTSPFDGDKADRAEDSPGERSPGTRPGTTTVQDGVEIQILPSAAPPEKKRRPGLLKRLRGRGGKE
jgi:acyl-homoserine-lactone acylase